MISLCPQKYNLREKCISENDRVIKEIGRGDNGRITLVEHKSEQLARKEVKMGRFNLENYERKIKILKGLNHENIMTVKDLRTNESDNPCYIYTESLENGSLSDLIKKQNNKDFELSAYIYIYI